MNIKSRLKTIEKKVIKPVSFFCLCYGTNLKYEIIPISLDEWKRRFDTGEDTLERLPDFCERCCKAVDKRFIETTFDEWKEKSERRINETIKAARQRTNN